jgi:F420-non-reducing hydrogenase large subunit
MSRKITINPVTRIEGHASVELEIDDEKIVTAACFKVLDFRGFETFLQGMQVEMMPLITARICGTCPHSHHLAAAKAVDKVFGVTIPHAATLLRTMLGLGGFIHSHAVHLFALAGPDLLLGLDAPLAQRNIMGLVEKYPDMSKKALRLRSIGQLVCEYVGGRGMHPVTMVAGGVSMPLDSAKVELLKKVSREAVALSRELYVFMKKNLIEALRKIEPLTIKTGYCATVNNNLLDFYDGDLRLITPGKEKFDFSIDTWASHIFEKTVDGSYSKQVYFTNGGSPVSYRVGALARLNCAGGIDTPLAQREFEEFRRLFGDPCHHTTIYHYARLIELLYAAEKLEVLANDPEALSDKVRVALGTPRKAVAHVEAPRGILIHDYDVDANGIVTGANLLVATQQNIEAINATVKMSAQKYLHQPDEIFLNAIEFGIRCYDPCLSCATHRLGEMKLDVVVRHKGVVVRQVRR